jgi:hypothetical protein
MSSPKQIKANQLNAAKSTGPKSVEGKAIVAKNAVKHGLLAAETVLPWENVKNLDDLQNDLLSVLKPEGALETLLVDRIISITWRLQRAGRIETGILTWKKYSELLRQSIVEYADTYSTEDHFGDLNSIFPPKTVIPDQEKYEAAQKNMHENSRLVNTELPVLGRVFEECADTIGTLHRYETGLERSLFKTLHELQRVQSHRRGDIAQLPIAIDIQGDHT